MVWPEKHDLFGVRISATDYDEAAALILRAGAARQSAVVTHLPVHGVVTAATDPAYRRAVNTFEIAAPDGQPVRWALNRLHGTGLTDRVYGPELALRLCRGAAERGIGIYLYGSEAHVIERFKSNLLGMFPSLRIVGVESPPFRPLTDEENTQAIDRINASGAGLLFVGLGCPRQDYFAHQNRSRIHAVQICMGAAFDFHAGNKRMAPRWMQKSGLEWLFRLIQEPRRLWKRYVITNSVFLYLLGRRILMRREGRLQSAIGKPRSTISPQHCRSTL